MVTGPDECDYKTQAEAMYASLRYTCGCGHPGDQHVFIIKCLEQFEHVGRSKRWSGPGVDGVKELVLKDPAAAAQFISHVLNEECLLEHGGSVFGSWLTDRGRQFIEIGPHGTSE